MATDDWRAKRKADHQDRDDAFKRKVSDARAAAAQLNDCPSCSHSAWTQLERYVQLPVKAKPDAVVSGVVSAVGLVCSRCGFVSLHVAGVLGLLS